MHVLLSQVAKSGLKVDFKSTFLRPLFLDGGLKSDLKTTLNELKVVFAATYSGLKVPFKSSLKVILKSFLSQILDHFA